MNHAIGISLVAPYSDIATVLIGELNIELSQRYADCEGEEATSFQPAHAVVPGSAFVVASLNGEPVGCGAIRPITDDVAEIKRMYVRGNARNLGVGQAILAELERLAVEYGYRLVVLETGERQPEAIALYRKRGFTPRAHFVKDAKNPLSVCLEKVLHHCDSPPS